MSRKHDCVESKTPNIVVCAVGSKLSTRIQAVNVYPALDCGGNERPRLDNSSDEWPCNDRSNWKKGGPECLDVICKQNSDASEPGVDRRNWVSAGSFTPRNMSILQMPNTSSRSGGLRAESALNATRRNCDRAPVEWTAAR